MVRPTRERTTPSRNISTNASPRPGPSRDYVSMQHRRVAALRPRSVSTEQRAQSRDQEENSGRNIMFASGTDALRENAKLGKDKYKWHSVFIF